MSWRYPDSNLTTNEVVTAEGLNDGFFPAASEAQGKLNEHNIASGAIPAAAFGGLGDAFIPDTHVAPTGVALEYVNTRGTNQTLPEGGTGATRGAWASLDRDNNGSTLSVFEYDGSVALPQSPKWNVIGTEEPPFKQSGVVDEPRPLRVSFFADEETTVWIMATFQVVEETTRGAMFCLRINGATVTESMFGSADFANDSKKKEVMAADVPLGEVGQCSPAAGGGSAGAYDGYPVCLEAVISVPPGNVVVEVVGVKVAPLSGNTQDSDIDRRMCTGNREIVILKMMR
jgi:hypothetical protein